jgi:hypothetical protein
MSKLAPPATVPETGWSQAIDETRRSLPESSLVERPAQPAAVVRAAIAGAEIPTFLGDAYEARASRPGQSVYCTPRCVRTAVGTGRQPCGAG